VRLAYSPHAISLEFKLSKHILLPLLLEHKCQVLNLLTFIG
jgi:hypothetical protein